eukprot:1141059-Pelagomonas_calceolata.AAC.1
MLVHARTRGNKQLHMPRKRGSARRQVLGQDIHCRLGMRTGPKDVLPLLEGSHIRSGCIRGLPTTDTRRASGPGNTMAPHTWDPLQEQAQPGLLLPVAPPEPLHLMDPAREVIEQVDGLGSWVWRRQA